MVHRKFKKVDKGPRRNEAIREPEIRLIDENGKMLGVINTQEALRLAENKGLDLVEVDPNSKPPVTKLIDYGKYKYELKKKQQESKKKQTNIVVKEVQFRPTIDRHDFDFKIKHIEKFISEGNKVKVCIVFKGRQLAHVDMADGLIEQIREVTKEYAIVENNPKLEGRRIILQLMPSKKVGA